MSDAGEKWENSETVQQLEVFEKACD